MGVWASGHIRSTMKVYKINLHGLNYEEANKQLIRFIESLWGREAELEIITGYSQGMRLVVANVLNEYNLTCQVGRSCDNNHGYMVTWLD